VPSAALHSEGDTTYVNKIVDGRTVKTTVEIGTAYGPVTEIVSGLREGDEVEIAVFVRGPGGGGDGGEGGDGGGPGGKVIMPGGDEFGGQFPGGK
jgi:macrolide-specific efflux system membrane fusion protein